MGRLTVLEVAAPQCVAQDFDGEIIALNLATGTYFSIRDLGAVLWRDLAAGHAVETLAMLAGGALGSAQVVRDFAADAEAKGLMRPAENSAPATEEPQVAAAIAAGVAPVLTLEVFEDMKNLLLLDPVHEVDESRGWPAPPKDA